MEKQNGDDEDKEEEGLQQDRVEEAAEPRPETSARRSSPSLAPSSNLLATSSL